MSSMTLLAFKYSTHSQYYKLIKLKQSKNGSLRVNHHLYLELVHLLQCHRRTLGLLVNWILGTSLRLRWWKIHGGVLLNLRWFQRYVPIYLLHVRKILG